MAAPHPEQVVAGCQGKVAFTTMTAASAHVKRIKRRRKFKRTSGEYISIYRCDSCRSFHLGRSFK